MNTKKNKMFSYDNLHRMEEKRQMTMCKNGDGSNSSLQLISVEV